MTETNKYLERFEAYQNGDLSPSEVGVFLTDLDQDVKMLAAWQEYIDMMDAFSDKEAVSLRHKLEGAFHRRQEVKIQSVSQNVWFRISAAAVVIVVMGALLYFFCSRNTDLFNFSDHDMLVHQDTVVQIDRVIQDNTIVDTLEKGPVDILDPVSTPGVVASIYDREEYQISPVFAELLHNVYRSGWFEIQTPVDSAMFTKGDSLIFSWETNLEEEIFFDILDRNGKVIYKHKDPVSSPWKYEPQLESAIYMYRFATKDQPVWMGVIIRE